MIKSITNSKKYLAILLSIFIGSIALTKSNSRIADELDASWQYSINYAVVHHLNFGNDIIFTYGPLGFISYNIAEGLNIGLLVFCWVIRLLFLTYFIGLLIEFAVNISVNTSKDIALGVKYILLPFMVYKFGQTDYSIIIFVCLIHSCVINVLNISGGSLMADFFLPKRKIWLNLFTGFTVSLLFFIKVSFFPFIVLVPVVVIFKRMFEKDYKNLLAFLGALIVTFGITYGCLNIDLKSYIANSIQIIAGYKSAMQMLTYDAYHSSYRLSVLLISLYLIQFYFIRKWFRKSNLVLLLIILMGVYFMFSYSYTRGWEGGLIYCIPVIVLLFYPITYIIGDLKWKIRIFNVITFVLVTCIMSFGDSDFFNLTAHLFVPTKKPAMLILPRQNINSTESYDVYPWNTSYCYFNHLKYQPRPVIQTYSCYTATLDSINAVFLAKKKADHIIFHGSKTNTLFGNTIDGRYFMFDEPQTKFEILKNYQISSQINDSLFITSKRQRAIKANLKEIKSFDFNLDKAYNIERDSAQSYLYYFTADFKYTTSSQVLSLIKRLPYIKVDVELKSGQLFTFNVVADMLKRPCILNRYCANYNDFFNLFVAGNEISPKDIKSLKFYSSSPGGFQSSFKMRIFRLEGI